MKKEQKLRKQMDKLMKESLKAREEWKAGEAERMCQYRHLRELLLRAQKATDPDVN